VALGSIWVTYAVAIGSSFLRNPAVLQSIPTGRSPNQVFGQNKGEVADFKRKPELKRSNMGPLKMLLFGNRKLHAVSVGKEVNDLR